MDSILCLTIFFMIPLKAVFIIFVLISGLIFSPSYSFAQSNNDDNENKKDNSGKGNSGVDNSGKGNSNNKGKN